MIKGLVGDRIQGTVTDLVWMYRGNRQYHCEDSHSSCVNLNSRSREFKPRILRILSQHEVTIFEMSFHFCVKVTNSPRVANNSSRSELKYSEVPNACIRVSTVTTNRRAILKEPNHLFTPSHYGLS